METLDGFGWVFYRGDDKNVQPNKTGKWMYFFSERALAVRLCKKAIKEKVVVSAKHSDKDAGVICFYLHYDDMDAHRRTIQFFLDNNLIRRTKAGKLYDISFKLDDQTRAGEYGDDFHSEIKLSKFINLDNGVWIV